MVPQRPGAASFRRVLGSARGQSIGARDKLTRCLQKKAVSCAIAQLHDDIHFDSWPPLWTAECPDVKVGRVVRLVLDNRRAPHCAPIVHPCRIRRDAGWNQRTVDREDSNTESEWRAIGR